MLRLSEIIGHVNDIDIAERIHALEHQGLVEVISLNEVDTQRKRLRLSTDKGTDCAVTLNRNASLENGSVLLLCDKRAIVIRLKEIPWLVLEPDSLSSAIELGFLAGHHHWRVKFEGSQLLVAVEQAEGIYKDRLSKYLEMGSVRIVGYR